MYELNNFRKKISDEILITNDSQDYSFLSKKEYEDLLNHKLKGKKLEELEEKGFVLTEKNKEKIPQRIRKKNLNLFRKTTLHIIIPTLRCNQTCIYCHAKSKGKNKKNYDMDKKTAKLVSDFILGVEQDNLQIEFQGGEPLLNFEIIRYITTYLKDKGIKNSKISIVTNLTLMDDEKLDFIKKHDIDICTSLDGPSYVHDKARMLNGGASYKDVVTWIKKLKKEYMVDALMVPTKFSLKYPKEIIDEYRNLGFSRIQLKPLSYLESAIKNWEKIGYSPEEFLEYYIKSMDYILELNKKGEKFKELIAYYILTKILTDKPSIFLDLQTPCGAAIGQMAYDYDGSIYTCDEGRNFDIFKLGDVFSDTHKGIMEKENTCSMIGASVNDNYICDNCVYKAYCGLCPVCNYAQTGNVITDIASSDRCKIFMGIFNYIFNKLKDPEIKKIFERWV